MRLQEYVLRVYVGTRVRVYITLYGSHVRSSPPVYLDSIYEGTSVRGYISTWVLNMREYVLYVYRVYMCHMLRVLHQSCHLPPLEGIQGPPVIIIK
jgi:hypothetical protein